MNRLVPDDEIWALPGPSRWVSQVNEDIRRRNHLLLDLPILGGPSSFRGWLTTSIDLPVMDLSIDDLPSEPTAKTMLSSLGRQLGDDEHPVETPRDLIEILDKPRCLWFDLCGLASERLTPMVESLNQLCRLVDVRNKDSRSPYLTFVIAVDHDSSSASTENLQTRSWRGAIDAIDGRVFAKMKWRKSGKRIPFSDLELLIETAGSDLELIALAFTQDWDGDIESLREVLTSRWLRRDLRPEDSEADDDEMWRLGVEVETTDESRRVALDHPRRIGDLNTFVWQVQLRTVFPVIEKYRQRVLEVAEREKKLKFIADLQTPYQDGRVVPWQEAEVGKMFHHGAAFREVRELLEWLKDTRNDLAHRRVVSGANLYRGRNLQQSFDETFGYFESN